MRRALVAVLAVGLLGLLLAALLDKERRAFTVGVASGGPAVELQPGRGVCQGVIDVPRGGAFDTVRVLLGTYFRPGPPVRVTVREPDGGLIAAGELPGGYPDIAERPFHDVEVGDVGDQQPVTVCLRNTGSRPVAVYGNAGAASRSTAATMDDGTELDADLDLVFLRAEAASVASLLPDVFRRAALFRPSGVGAWTYWVLLVLLVVAVPALLWHGCRHAEAASEEDA